MYIYGWMGDREVTDREERVRPQEWLCLSKKGVEEVCAGVMQRDVLLLCVVGFLLNCKPSEPFLTPFLRLDKGGCPLCLGMCVL